MTKNKITRKVILYEAIGFGLVILVLWLNELFDIPHNLFGLVATPVNWAESIIESIIVFFLGAIFIFTTLKLLERIKYLEGFLPVCSFCKKIRKEKKWIPIEVYITEHSEAEFTHSFCPECAEKHYGVPLKEIMENYEE